jgi:hypothetical protein
LGNATGRPLPLFAVMAFVGLAINVGITTISAPQRNANHRLVSKRAFRESKEGLHLTNHGVVWSLSAFAVAGARRRMFPSAAEALFSHPLVMQIPRKVTNLCDQTLLQHFDAA